MATFQLEKGQVPSAGTEQDTLILPRGFKGDGTLRGIIYCHGLGENAMNPTQGTASAKSNESELLRQIGEIYPIIIADLGVVGGGGTTDAQHWGNANGQLRVGQCKTRIQALGAKAGKIVLFGISMGHALACTYAQANAANVQAIAGVIPLCDLDDLRDNNRPVGTGGNRPSMEAAWATGAWVSVGSPALPAAANPAKVANLTNILTIQHKMWYASDDLIILPATVTTMAANIGAAAVATNLGAVGGHSDATIGTAGLATSLLAFLAANA